MPLAYLDDAYPDKILLKTEFTDKDAVQRILARKWSAKDKVWILPRAWSSCLQMRAEFGDRLELDDKLTRWSHEYFNTVLQPASKIRESLTLDDLDDVHPYVPIAQTIKDELKLFDHQPTGAAYMAISGSCGIFDETGTGKSAQAITALRTLHRGGRTDIFPALIVAPNSVKTTWAREWAKWWPGLIIKVLEGSPVQRRKALESKAHVYIANYEQMHKHSRLASYGNQALQRCVPCGGLDERVTHEKCEIHEREFNQIDWNTVVVDEAHRILAPSKQTRAIWEVSKNASYRYALTGTPIQDNMDDYWFILRYLRPNEFPSKVRFIDRYADMGYNSWGIMQINGVRSDREEEFQAVTKPLARRMLKKIVLPFLPPIIREQRFIPLSPPQRKAYKQMVKEALAELDDSSTGTIAAASPLSKATRLLQFASSYAEFIDPDGKKIPYDPKKVDELSWEEVEAIGDDFDEEAMDPRFALCMPSNKITAFLEDVQNGDFGESSVVVFAQSKQLIDLLSTEMTKKKIDHGLIVGGQSTDERQQNIDDFQNKKFKYILVTIQAGGVGLTLTAADVNVFLQRSYSSTAMKQSLSRSHRIGQESDKVTIIDYVSEGTIEEAQLLALEEKDGRIEAILKDRELLKKFIAGE
ncbi:DNA helicase [Gordonia phage GodonK]|uniref:DNA helicase n=1 Tax=Gordonia phage GodonK TaxID=2562192 RepID=A0A4D6E403_9CAUD|nr:DNA helicase [Gordonia phage GodonK]QBZ72772.1 DNA helicase [Gordonia phage GodonK]